ncbi:MAG: RNAse Z [Bacteroidota bacterium]
MGYTISCYSTALFSTWFFIEELGLLFDAGDGVSASLLQKSRKVKQVFISHADRDHINGLPQFYQLNARPGFPKIYYPKDSGSFPALASFLGKFDPHLSGVEWEGITENMIFHIKGDIYVESIRNGHVQVGPEVSKSLSYKVVRKTRRLKSEFRELSGQEIAKLAKEKGQDFLTQEYREEVLGYSGDTPVEDYARWKNTQTLIHEATFLTNDPSLNNKRNKHSTLPVVMQMVAKSKVQQLILSHFSSRYSQEEIDGAIRKNCDLYNIQIPVYRVLPGLTYVDVLMQGAVNA